MTTTFPVTLTVTGTGWCHFGATFENTNVNGGYVNASQAHYRSYKDQYNYTIVWVCRHDDGMLSFHDAGGAYLDSPNFQVGDGTLTH